MLCSCEDDGYAPAEVSATEAKSAGQSEAVDGPGNAGEKTAAAEKKPRLSGGESSVEGLLRAVLEAIRRRDPNRLKDLMVSREEYMTHVFPEFPQARDPRHTFTPEFHWGHLEVTSKKGRYALVQDYGGLELELLEWEPTAGVKDHETYRLYSYVRVRVKQKKSGITKWIEVTESVLEMDGRYKVLSYPD